MARPRVFDQDQAIKGATEIFWRQGFKSTNLPDLLKAMKMSRGSFYLAFGTKQNVYALALDHYDKHVLNDVVMQLNSCEADEAWECLAPLFQPPPDDGRGCFICNAMVELGPENPDIADKANGMAERLRAAIEKVLLKRGDQTKLASVEQCADMNLHLYFGHQALGKAGRRKNDWKLKLKSLLHD